MLSPLLSSKKQLSNSKSNVVKLITPVLHGNKSKRLGETSQRNNISLLKLIYSFFFKYLAVIEVPGSY